MRRLGRVRGGGRDDSGPDRGEDATTRPGPDSSKIAAPRSRVPKIFRSDQEAGADVLYAPGLRLHIKNAIGYGATREEILEVMELASVIGIHSCTVGVPILVEELAAAGSAGA